MGERSGAPRLTKVEIGMMRDIYHRGQLLLVFSFPEAESVMVSTGGTEILFFLRCWP